MTNTLAIFQVGPVQEFIACARKTQDLWSGSYLLSYLSCIAINSVVQQSGRKIEDIIVYPAVKDQKIFSYIERNSALVKPWTEKPTDEECRPTVPNRFVAELDENKAADVLKKAEEKVQQVYRDIATEISDSLKNNIKNSTGFDPEEWENVWTRQIKNAFEIYWAIHAINPFSYSKSYMEAESLFGARKAIRNFQPVKEPGYKCTLCGLREPLHAHNDDSLNRKKLQDFWKYLNKNIGGSRFKDNEHLCAVCTTKRLTPEYIFARRFSFPSTSSVAAADYVQTVTTMYRDVHKQLVIDGVDLVQDLIYKVKTASGKTDEPYQAGAMPSLINYSLDIDILNTFIRMDGDWLFKETYDNLKTDANTSIIDNAWSTVKKLELQVKKIAGNDRSMITSPAKYYAIFQMDGDNMGEHISACQSQQEHLALSQATGHFAGVKAFETLENNNLGKIIYFGGDEGLTFISLQSLLPAMENCRINFSSSLKARGITATSCTGAVIVHHQQALRQALSETHLALDRAKEFGTDKNSFCIAVMKRSGGVTYAMARWEYGDFKVVPFLIKLAGYYRQRKLSTQWWRQLATEEWAFKQTSGSKVLFDADLAGLEISRLLPRHAHLGEDDIERLLLEIKQLIKHIDTWDNFLGLMELPDYIARGGGR